MTEIGAGFAVILALMAGIGWLALDKLYSVNANSEAIYQRQLTGISYIKQANANLAYAGRSVWLTIAQADDPAEASKAFESWKIYQDRLRESLSKGQAVSRSDEAQPLLENLDKALTAAAAQEEVITLAKDSRAQAARALKADLLQKVQRADDAMAALATYLDDEARATNQANSASYEAARTAILIIGTLALICSFVIGFTLAQSLSSALGQTR